MADNTWMNDVNDIELTDAEQRAIRSLMRLSAKWPRSLIIFGGNGSTTSIRKFAADGSYFNQREVATIAIPSDGGDGGDRS